jgi:hypothetical protein
VHLHLVHAAAGEEKSEQPHAQRVASLLYISDCTRPDKSQAVGALSRHMAHPTAEHWAAAKDRLRYVKSTATLGITYGEKEGVVGYGDTDFAVCLDTRRSMTGVEDMHLSSLCAIGSARGVWQHLAQQYAAASRARSLQLRKNLLSCSMTNNANLSEFVR